MSHEYDSLANRVAVLEARIAELATYLQSALHYLSSDPQSSLTKSRVILEKLLIALYRTTMKRNPPRPMIGDMLSDKEFVASVPRRIIARMNAVRDMSNLGPHGGDVDMTDAVRVMRDLLDVLEWYAINSEPMAGAGASHSPRDAIEILPELKVKFPNYLRPEITSVKFAQSQGRCYLEMTTAETVAGYRHRETTRREDLAFISSGSQSDARFFDPAASVLSNADKFVSDMDAISIINYTDLFQPEIAEKRSTPSRSGAPSVRLDGERFLRSCPPEAKDFFAKVLDEAQNRGLQVRWASESFLVHQKGRLLDFFRCKVGGYLELFVRDVSEELRSQLLSLPAATKSARFVITIPVTRETLSNAESAWKLALQTVLA